MINAKAILQMVFIAGLLILSACAGPQITPFPEGHPADPGLREPTVERSMTLADPDPVDTAPARSEHFDNNDHDENDHDPHDPNDHDSNGHDHNGHDHNGHHHNDHDHNDHDIHEDAQPEHQEKEHRHHEMNH